MSKLTIDYANCRLGIAHILNAISSNPVRIADSSNVDMTLTSTITSIFNIDNKT